jgi:hypothetical protein
MKCEVCGEETQYFYNDVVLCLNCKQYYRKAEQQFGHFPKTPAEVGKCLQLAKDNRAQVLKEEKK